MLLSRRRRTRHFWLRAGRRYVAWFRLSRPDIIAAGRRQRALLQSLWALFSRLDAIPVLLFGGLNIRRRLLARLAIFRLLIISLLLAAGRGRRHITALLIAGTLFLPDIRRLSAVMAHILGRARFAHDIPHRAWCEIAARGSTDGIHSRPAVFKHRPLAAIDVN